MYVCKLEKDPEMTTQYTFDENIVSDLHKDARGFRPGQSWWQMWNALGDAEKQNVWDALCDELDNAMAAERDAYARAEIDFHQRVQGMMLVGAADELTAIRWILEAEQLTEYDLAYGSDYVAFHFGLPYKGLFDQQIQVVIDMMQTQKEAA
jgi:hypothetical protein